MAGSGVISNCDDYKFKEIKTDKKVQKIGVLPTHESDFK